MKKIFSLFAAVLFAASMMASVVIFTNADFAGQGTPNTGSQVSASIGGVTFTYSKGYSADESLRCYAHGALSISAEEKISKINFTTTGGKTGGLDAEVTVNAWDYEVADLASQARFTEIKVTLGEGGGDEPGGDTPVVPGDVITCAEAVSAAQAGSTAQVTVIGYVTEIAYAWKNGSMSFWMADTKDGGKVFEAYKCECAEADAPAVGDLVEATGTLTMYNTTAELAAGCTVVIIEKAGGDTPVVPGDAISCAEAVSAAQGGSTDQVTVRGYVTEIAYAWKNGSMSFWMADSKDGGKVFEAYKCECAEADAPAVGDLVEATGTLTMYNTTAELAAGCTVVIIEKAGGDDPVVPGDVITCAEAVSAAQDGSTDQVTVRGYVTDIAYAWKNGSMSFWMADTKDGGKVFEAYKCECAEADAPAVGDLVEATGNLTMYNTTAELAAGCTVVIIEKAGGDTPVVPGDAISCAEAVSAAQGGSTDQVTVRGYVTDIAYAWKNGSMSFWMADTKDGGKVFEAYKCECAEADAPAVGDLVEATGTLTMYNTTAELAAGCTVVIIEKAGGDTPVVTDPTNCAEAAAAALSVSENNELYNGGKEYTIQGFVTSIAFPWKEGTMSFWMADTENGGNVLEAYKCAVENEADAVRVGDKVAVTGKLTKYNKTPEFAAGCTVDIIERAPEDPNPPVVLGEMTIAEFLELKNFKDTCILTGVVANIVMDKQDETQYNKYGNFDLVELDNEEVQVYIYGLLTADGVAQQFNEMGIDEGDTLVIKAVYSEYNNKPQVKNAVFVEVYKGEGGGEEGEYSYDWEPTEITTVTINADALNIQDYSADYGVVYISLDDTESGKFAVLEFNTESFDGLEVGTYPIDDTEEFGTFWASPGGDDSYDYGCYVGVPDPTDPEYYIPYYLISGSVQIGASGDIYVRATSYNGSTIIISYVAPEEQGIENTKVSTGAVKTLRNGMLLIEKNGKTFNTIGQIVK